MLAQLAVAILLGAGGGAAKRFELDADHSFTGAAECSTTSTSSTSTRFLNTTAITSHSTSTTSASTTLLTTTTSSTTEVSASTSLATTSTDSTSKDPIAISTTTTTSTTSPPVDLTTSTVFTTATYTVTKCPEGVNDCPEGEGSYVVTETIPLYTTVCPVSTTNDEHAPAKPTEASQRETITTVATRTYTISACPPYVIDCPIGSLTSELVTATYCPDDDIDTTTYTMAFPTHPGDGSVTSATETECEDFVTSVAPKSVAAPSVAPTPIAPVHETTPVEDDDAPFDVSPPAGDTTGYEVDTHTKAWNSGFSTATSNVTTEATSPAGVCDGPDCPVGGSGKIGAGGALSLVLAAAVLLL